MVELRYAILFVSDLERSIRFYRDLLGLPVESEDRDQAEFQTGRLILTLHQAHVDAPHHTRPSQVGGLRLGFHVEDFDGICDRLREAGTLCLSPPEERMGVRMALFEDPDGYHLTIAADA